MFTDTQAWIITISVLAMAIVAVIAFFEGHRKP